MESHTAVIIPLDDRVIFVRLLNCAEFSRRFSEVAQALDAIPGIQVRAGRRGLGEPWLLGAVGVRGSPGVRQGRLRSPMQFGYRLTRDVGHIPLSFQGPRTTPSAATVRRLDRYTIDPERMVDWSKLHSFDNRPGYPAGRAVRRHRLRQTTQQTWLRPRRTLPPW